MFVWWVDATSRCLFQSLERGDAQLVILAEDCDNGTCREVFRFAADSLRS